MNKGFVLEKCIYGVEWFVNYKDDYPFCENAMTIVEKGLDSSTIPSKEFRQVQEKLTV